MKRTPLELAAIASAAVPGLAPTGVAGLPDDTADFDSAVLIDDAGKQWRVRSPKHAEASMRLETELLVLRGFNPGVRADLPFNMPSVAGTVRLGELTTFVYSHLPGFAREIDVLVGEDASVPAEIGRAMAAIHDLPPQIVRNADLPSYTANEFRQRKLNELDQAATTGKIPSVLLRRWEHALEDVSLWRFNPCVVHGDLHEDNLLLSAGRVTAVTGWTDLRIGDPADDFAWLIASNESSFADKVLAAYTEARREKPDRHLLRRAALSAEFALAQWLVRGVAAENHQMIDEAEEMLATLEADIVANEDTPSPAGFSASGAAGNHPTGAVPVQPGQGQAGQGQAAQSQVPQDGAAGGDGIAASRPGAVPGTASPEGSTPSDATGPEGAADRSGQLHSASGSSRSGASRSSAFQSGSSRYGSPQSLPAPPAGRPRTATDYGAPFRTKLQDQAAQDQQAQDRAGSADTSAAAVIPIGRDSAAGPTGQPGAADVETTAMPVVRRRV